MLKTAIVGIGCMGSNHLYCHHVSEYTDPVAVVEVQEEAAREKVKAFALDIPVYTDIEKMISEVRPDIVDIATPTYTHKELAIRAMEAGCHVICEKPMALTPEDAREMIEVSKRTGKRLMIAHVVRFMAPYMYLKHTVKSGKLGRLLRLNMTRNSEIPRWSFNNWMTDVEKSGGEIIDLSIHDIDFVNFLLSRPEKISCVHYTLKNDTEFSSVSFSYDGISVSIEGGWYSAKIPFRSSFCAYFENGMIEADGDSIKVNGEPAVLTSDSEEIKIDGKAYEWTNGYRKEIEYFTDCIENGKPFSMSEPESSLSSLSLCLEIKEKAEKI